jgi:hypothetical protein
VLEVQRARWARWAKFKRENDGALIADRDGIRPLTGFGLLSHSSVYNHIQLTLIHPQLKVGTANERPPFTGSGSSQHNSIKENRDIKSNKER